MEAKEEIRSRLNIEDVIGQYVQLKRALIGTYDKVYTTVLSERMASVAALAQTVGAASSEPKVKTAIETMQANIAEIQKQLSQLQL